MSESFNLGKWRFATVTEPQRRDPGWKPFDWAMNFHKYRNMGGLLIYGEALHPGVTRNMDEYSKEEIVKAARMLIGKRLEIDRHDNLMAEENIVMDAEPVNGVIQYIARVTDAKAIERIKSGDLRWTSFNGMCRYTPDYTPGAEPRGCEGLLLFRLCLVGESSPYPPGDSATSVKVWASMEKYLRKATFNRHATVERTPDDEFLSQLRIKHGQRLLRKRRRRTRKEDIAIRVAIEREKQ